VETIFKQAVTEQSPSQ